MPEMDLDPGDYRERKPKGWRWRLPWSHPQDTKLPMVGFFVMAGFLAYIGLNLAKAEPPLLYGGTALFAFLAGGCFVLWLGRD